LSAADIEAGRLRELAGQVMTEPAFRRAAAALQQSMRECGGTNQPWDEILAFAARVSV
jgi:UDP:flavonoid glycosyltransferase YjiC (YdhE family)